MESFGAKFGLTHVQVRTRIVNTRVCRKKKEKKMMKEMEIAV